MIDYVLFIIDKVIWNKLYVKETLSEFQLDRAIGREEHDIVVKEKNQKFTWKCSEFSNMQLDISILYLHKSMAIHSIVKGQDKEYHAVVRGLDM